MIENSGHERGAVKWYSLHFAKHKPRQTPQHCKNYYFISLMVFLQLCFFTCHRFVFVMSYVAALIPFIVGLYSIFTLINSHDPITNTPSFMYVKILRPTYILRPAGSLRLANILIFFSLRFGQVFHTTATFHSFLVSQCQAFGRRRSGSPSSFQVPRYTQTHLDTLHPDTYLYHSGPGEVKNKNRHSNVKRRTNTDKATFKTWSNTDKATFFEIQKTDKATFFLNTNSDKATLKQEPPALGKKKQFIARYAIPRPANCGYACEKIHAFLRSCLRIFTQNLQDAATAHAHLLLNKFFFAAVRFFR
jgi:hypothetical protein